MLNLSEVKQAAADSVSKVKERLGLKAKEAESVVGSVRRASVDRTVPASPSPKHDGVKPIQDENAELHKAVRGSQVLRDPCGLS